MKKTLSIILLSSFLAGCWDTNEGQRVGVIVKVAKEGAIWGTWEGEIVRGGLQDASGANGLSFHFGLGIFKNEMVEKAILCMNKNKPVTIHYSCEMFAAPWRSKTGCFVTEIIEHDK